MIDPKAASIATILFLLRRILKLSDTATLQDIVDALNAIEQQPEALIARSAVWFPGRKSADSEKINRLLQVTPEMLRKWAA